MLSKRMTTNLNSDKAVDELVAFYSLIDQIYFSPGLPDEKLFQEMDRYYRIFKDYSSEKTLQY